MNRTEAINKIKKLLKLSSSPIREEAEAASAKASEIMNKFELDSTALELNEDPKDKEEVKNFDDDPIEECHVIETWKSRLITTLAHAHGCQAYKTSGTLKLIGRPSDVETVRYLYALIKRQILDVTEDRCKGNGRVYKSNFKLGMTDTICQKIRTAKENAERQFAQEAEATDRSTALMVVNNAMTIRKRHLDEAITYGNKVLHLRTGRSYGPQHNGEARHKGQTAGHSVRIGGEGQATRRHTTQLTA